MSSPKRVLVVGGGLGIGETITEYLIRQHAAKVVVLGLHISDSLKALQSTASTQLRILQGDITCAATRDEARAAVLEFMGGLDSLVITVGVMGEVQRLRNMNMSGLQRAYDINLFAPMAVCQNFLPELLKTKGNIIILSSAVDRKIKYAGWIQYCSTKAALTRFIETFAHEEPEIKVHGVYPGLTKTTMPDDVIAGKYKGIMMDEEIERFVNWDREGSIEPPEWCANAVARICTGVVDVSGSGECRYYYEYDLDFRVGISSEGK